MKTGVVIFQVIAFFILGKVFAASGGSDPVMLWSDLGIVEQVRIVAGLMFMVLLGIAAIVIFRSVWVKNGYAGLDQVLVDKEVALFMSHVLAFALLEVFFFMILFYNHTQPPSYAFWICGAGFLSPEVVQALHFIMDQIKGKRENK